MVQAEMLAAKALVEATRHKVQTKLKEVEAWTERGAYQRIGTGPGATNSPKFDGSTSRAVFRRQFETVAEHNCWTSLERATYLIAAFQVRVSTCYTEPRKERPMRKPLRRWRITLGTSTWPPHIAVRGPPPSSSWPTAHILHYPRTMWGGRQARRS
jgi:hypothetical protein